MQNVDWVMEWVIPLRLLRLLEHLLTVYVLSWRVWGVLRKNNHFVLSMTTTTQMRESRENFRNCPQPWLLLMALASTIAGL